MKKLTAAQQAMIDRANNPGVDSTAPWKDSCFLGRGQHRTAYTLHDLGLGTVYSSYPHSSVFTTDIIEHLHTN